MCPLLLQTLKGRVDFPLLVRLLRTVGTVAVELGDCLLPQCEVLLTVNYTTQVAVVHGAIV